MTNVVITHGYSDSNKGDLAITVGTILGIRETIPDASIILHSMYSESDPEFKSHSRFCARIGVPVVEGILPSPYIDSDASGWRRNLQAFGRFARSLLSLSLILALPSLLPALTSRQARALRMVKDADLIIAKGGQYIYNDQRGIRGSLYLSRMLKIITTATRLRKPTILLGHSIGPLVGGRASSAVRAALSSCSSIVVRERLSYQLLSDLGVKGKLQVAPDMAFLIEPCRPNGIELAVTDGPWIGVTVVNWAFPELDNCEGKRSEYLDAIVDSLTWAYRELDFKPALFSQVTVRHHGQGDQELLDIIEARLKDQNIPVRNIRADLSPSELSYLYGCCELVLGTRLHSCILAACAGCPSIAIRYQGHKTDGVMESLGLENYVQDIYELDVYKLRKSMQRVVQNRKVLSAEISKGVRRFRSEIIATIESVTAGPAKSTYNSACRIRR